MWVVLEKKQLRKVIDRIPQQTLIKYEMWKRTVTLMGPVGLKEIKGFQDKALKGRWKGFRSSRLSHQWRIIYKVEERVLQVYVLELTPHNY